MKTTKKNSASTLLAVLALLVILSACMYGALNYTATVSFNVMGTNTLRRATEVGDGAMNYMFAYWRELMKEQPSALPPTSNFTSIPLPPSTLFPGLVVASYTTSRGANPTPPATPLYTIANYQVQAVDPQMNTLGASTPPPASYGMSPTINTTNYLASCDVTLPAFIGRPLTVHMRRIFQKQITSPWQYAIFYNDLLEINPGAAMTITGWVHTNSSLYTGGDGSGNSFLTFQSPVDYGNDWADNPITFAPYDTNHSTPTTTQPGYPSNLPPARGEIQLPFGMDPTQIFTNTDPNNVSYRELIMPPNASYPDPISGSRYYDQADIRILVNSSGTITMTDNANNTLSAATVATGSTASALDKALYNTFSGAIAVNTGTHGTGVFQDAREGVYMNLVEFDVSKLTSALTATSATVPGTGVLLSTPANPLPYPGYTGPTSTSLIKGIVYIANSASTATSSPKWGVRIKNGATLNAGLTVTSENPVYIMGDYNTGETSSKKTPTNSDNNGTGNNYVTNYVEQPSAVLGDAVTILSNAWSDTNTTLSARNATPTTVNTAIVSGIDPTSSSYSGANSYSGGAENFPRFLENWGSQTFTYYGSMVELYTSQQATGRWGNSNVYDPPNRNWHFDPLFYTNPPPGTLQIVTYVKGRWYVQ